MMQNSDHGQSSLVAVAQLCATNDKADNFDTCRALVEKAVDQGAKMVFLPEGCDYIAETKMESLEFAESLNGKTISHFKDLASVNDVWLSLGGIHIREEDESKLSNMHIVIDNKGELISSYNKTHLFNVSLPERNVNLKESSYVVEGDTILPPVPTVAGMLGMAVCYDMRFPELSMIQRRLGAEILTFPSAFTVATGLAHWEPLLRARAIENQCYVIAAAQTGSHNAKRSSYGHSMIIDPWGAVVAQTSEGQNIAVAEVNIDYLRKVRNEMPVMTHRRTDLYHTEFRKTPEGPHLMELTTMPSNYSSYVFGQVMVPGSCFFIKTKLSQAFVNIKPVVPGHCLITPEKPHRRFGDLSQAELCDLAQVTQLAEAILFEKFKVNSAQIAIQDGQLAGQTIEHVHVHILPWEISQQNPSSKPTLQKHEKAKRKERSIETMSDEALQLRQITTELSKDIYNIKSCDLPRSVNIEKMITGNSFMFKKFKIMAKDILLLSDLCYAFKAINPVLPGHAYITFKEPILSFGELSCRELYELFYCIQNVQQIIEKKFDTSSSTIVILDGKESGQSIEQIHVHVIPRYPDDLVDNDDIYEQIQRHNLILSMPCTPDTNIEDVSS